MRHRSQFLIANNCSRTACHSCDLFNKAYNHISERIDQVYKDLTKGKAAPMGGVAYLSLEDSEVCVELPRERYLLD